jgi:ribosomal protein S27AE
MPYFCPYCAEVFLANIHRHECPECGYFLTQQLEEI